MPYVPPHLRNKGGGAPAAAQPRSLASLAAAPMTPRNESSSKHAATASRSQRANAMRGGRRAVSREELARYASEVVVSAAVGAIATESGWCKDSLTLSGTVPAIELLRQEKLEELEHTLTELCAAEGLPRGIQGALNRWLLVNNVQLAVGPGAAVTDPTIPDIFLSVRKGTVAVGCTIIEPELHKELTGKRLSPESADRVCKGLAETASAACARERASHHNSIARDASERQLAIAARGSSRSFGPARAACVHASHQHYLISREISREISEESACGCRCSA